MQHAEVRVLLDLDRIATCQIDVEDTVVFEDLEVDSISCSTLHVAGRSVRQNDRAIEAEVKFDILIHPDGLIDMESCDDFAPVAMHQNARVLIDVGDLRESYTMCVPTSFDFPVGDLWVLRVILCGGAGSPRTVSGMSSPSARPASISREISLTLMPSTDGIAPGAGSAISTGRFLRWGRRDRRRRDTAATLGHQAVA